ncbi:MAG: hypothetical protein P8J32_03380 [bacterium]|nr:hypothetical protein [bacterium]
MADNEARVGNHVLNEGTEVKTNIKTILFVASGLFVVLSFLFTVFYFDMKSEIDSTNTKVEGVLEQVESDVEKKVEDDMRDFLDRQIEIKEDIGEMKGDIKVILDRTSGSQANSGHTIFEPESAPPMSSGPPAESIPENAHVPDTIPTP